MKIITLHFLKVSRAIGFLLVTGLGVFSILASGGGGSHSFFNVNAGPDQIVHVGDTVYLDGSGSEGTDLNAAKSYEWTFLSIPAGSNAAFDSAQIEKPSFVADVAGNYEIQLTFHVEGEATGTSTVMVTALEEGDCANPLELTTSLPFSPGVGETASMIRINSSGGDTLSVVAANMAAQDSDVYMAYIPNADQIHQGWFEIQTSSWEEVSRSHDDPVNDTDSPSFIVRNIEQGSYYKINVDFTGTALLEAQIDALSGCRCGSQVSDCPQ
jgi:hypothetical protein